MKKFDLNIQYQLYLHHAGLDESKMHPAQRVETKRTFFAAFGQAILLMRDEVSELEEEAAVDSLQDIMNQVQDFFQAEANRKN